MAGKLQRFLFELGRRRVPRVMVAYAVAVFGGLQGADIIVTRLDLPGAWMTWLVIGSLAGVPLVGLLAWLFDLTPAGIVLTKSLTPHEQAAQAHGVHRWPVIAAMLLVVGAVTGGVVFWRARAHSRELPRDRVAVLPFTVRGSEQYGYLREGMVDLLAQAIGGGGALRTVDERALLRAARERLGELDAESGAALSRRFGARLYVLGSVLEVKDRLRLSAQLFEADDPPELVAEASQEGEAAKLFELVNALLRQLRPGLLARARLTGPASGLTALAEQTTESLPALKAFLEGEQQLRRSHYDAAAQLLQRAVAEDPSFAVAHYRLAVAKTWLNDYATARTELAEALKSKGKLLPRELRMLEAFSSLWTGRAADAERRYREILAGEPDNAEAWYELGEVLFHEGPHMGRSYLEAKGPLTKAFDLDPDGRLPVAHLRDIAFAEMDRPGIARWSELMIDSSRLDAPQREGLRWGIAWARGETTAQHEIEERTAKDTVLIAGGAATMAVLPGGLDEGHRLLAYAEGTHPKPGSPEQTQLLNVRVMFAMLEGRVGDAARGLAEWRAVRPEAAATPLGLLPLMPADREQLAKACRSVPPPERILGLTPSLQKRVHDYLAGLCAAALQDAAGVEDAAARLEASRDEDDSAQGHDLALALRAQHELASGRPAEAVAYFEKTSGGVPYPLVGLGYFSGAREGFYRGEALRVSGRLDEALRWYGAVGGPTTSGWYTAPVLLRQAQVLEQLGRGKEALPKYQEFLARWRDCDVSLKPYVEDARAHLAALLRERGPSASLR